MATVFPAREYAIENRGDARRLRAVVGKLPTSRWDWTFQTLTSPDSEGKTIVLLSGENATSVRRCLTAGTTASSRAASTLYN